MVYADLHVHTTASDGSLALADLPAAARAAGVSVVAVTDHDRVHPALDAPCVERGGVTLVRGVELRVESSAGRVDLLGYGVRETDALAAELDRLQRDRVERAREMVRRLEAELGVSLSVPLEHGVGRPHVARAVASHPDLDLSYGEVFERYIGDDGPCYVARDVPDFERGRALLGDACRLVSLAHPLRYADPDAALELAPALGAVERNYPYEGDADLARVDRAVERHDLLVTGGSDAHDESVGACGVDRETYRTLRRAGRGSPEP